MNELECDPCTDPSTDRDRQPLHCATLVGILRSVTASQAIKK